jgi:hypothetical protein
MNLPIAFVLLFLLYLGIEAAEPDLRNFIAPIGWASLGWRCFWARLRLFSRKGSANIGSIRR